MIHSRYPEKTYSENSHVNNRAERIATLRLQAQVVQGQIAIVQTDVYNRIFRDIIR